MADKKKRDPGTPTEISEDDLENVTGGADLSAPDNTSEVQVIILQPGDLSANGFDVQQVVPVRESLQVEPVETRSSVTPIKDRK